MWMHILGTLGIKPRSFRGWEWNCLALNYSTTSHVGNTVPLVKLVYKDLMRWVCECHDATEQRHSIDACPDTTLSCYLNVQTFGRSLETISPSLGTEKNKQQQMQGITIWLLARLCSHISGQHHADARFMDVLMPVAKIMRDKKTDNF